MYEFFFKLHRQINKLSMSTTSKVEIRWGKSLCRKLRLKSSLEYNKFASIIK